MNKEISSEMPECSKINQEVDTDMDISIFDSKTVSNEKENINEKESQLQNADDNFEIVQCNTTYHQEQVNITNDPATWPKIITSRIRDYLVKEGPPKILLEDFPRQENGTHFSKVHCRRKLPNGESIYRPWIIYSESVDKIFRFYCRLFGNDTSALTTTGLSEHEKSKSHPAAMLSCSELQKRLSVEQTIDKVQQKILNEEKMKLCQVFERFVAVVQFLAERNLAFRGSVEKLGNPNNGNFIGMIELLGRFDPVIHDHLRRFPNKETNEHYLSKNIQNELLNIMGNAVQSKIISRIKYAKYFAIILYCTPDISHQE